MRWRYDVILSARRVLLPLAAGLLGAAILGGLYLSIVSLAESLEHALDLFWQDKAFVVPILIGFGIQVGLYTFLKKGLYVPSQTPVGATTAAGGGMSTVAMVACCAHHAADVFPVLGLTAAATFLASWKIPFMSLGLVMNLIGILVMMREISKARRGAAAPAVSSAVIP